MPSVNLQTCQYRKGDIVRYLYNAIGPMIRFTVIETLGSRVRCRELRPDGKRGAIYWLRIWSLKGA